MFRVNVVVETYSERFCDRIEVKAASETSARSEAERQIMNRFGSSIVFIQITDIARI